MDFLLFSLHGSSVGCFYSSNCWRAGFHLILRPDSECCNVTADRPVTLERLRRVGSGSQGLTWKYDSGLAGGTLGSTSSMLCSQGSRYCSSSCRTSGRAVWKRCVISAGRRRGQTLLSQPAKETGRGLALRRNSSHLVTATLPRCRCGGRLRPDKFCQFNGCGARVGGGGQVWRAAEGLSRHRPWLGSSGVMKEAPDASP